MKEYSNIYVYKLTTDNGGAPCVYNNNLSLAICKPTIRTTIDENDWLLGFGGKATLGERLIFIAEITNKIFSGGYYKNNNYYNRPDCIYRWDSNKREYYWLKSKKYHKDGKFLVDDLGKKNNQYKRDIVLLSDNFRYFGKEGTDNYKSIYPKVKSLIEKLSQGHRVNHSIELRKEFKDLIEQYMKYKNGQRPSQSDQNIRCNNIDDCMKRIKQV